MSKRKTKIERPFWQAGPCPQWCAGYHSNRDPLDRRTHQWEAESVLVLTVDEEAVVRDQQGREINRVAKAVNLGLEQGVREVEPRVVIFISGADSIPLTLREAKKLIRHLEKAVRRAEGGAR